MNRLFTVLGLAFLGLTAANCNKDDGNGGNEVVNLRDRKEVRDENAKQIEEFLAQNYLIIEGDNIRFDSISNPNKPNPNVVPLKDDKRIKIEQQIITSDNYEYEAVRNPNGTTSLKFSKPKDELEYTIAYFIVPDADGNKQEGKGDYISTIDSVFVKTKSYSLKNESFDNNGNIGSYYSFPITLKEFALMSQGNYGLIPVQLKTAERQLLTKVKTAPTTALGENGIPTYEKGSAGRIIAFIPSGVGYFNAGYGSKLKAYQPHIIDMTLIAKKERDHDGDGILSKYEAKQVIEKSSELGRALTDDEIRALKLTIKDYFDFDTDEDGVPNFLDDDDDGDGILTKTELQYKDKNNKKAYYQYYDPILKTCSNVFRYLDRTCFPDQKDGEVIWPTKK
ncbi:EF-hand domain-containing protein [Myroides odoratimimus]|uniref:EF-hand domain-containing protein n=1 Tax=Myroides odoratimimus TaxID=76832 RepID=UPI0031017E89